MKAYIYGILANFNLMKYKREKAIHYFEKAMEKNTHNPLVIYNYGLILLQDGFFEKALNIFLKVGKIVEKKVNKKSLKPASLDRNIILHKNIPLAISSCYWRLNDIPKAIETLENLRKNYEYVSPNALTTLGYFYLLDKNYDKALEISKLAIEDTEDFASAWDNIGQIYFEKGDINLAYENFLKSIKYNENSVDSLYHLAVIDDMNGDVDSAIKYLERASLCNITSLNTVDKPTIEAMLTRLKKS